MLRDSPPTSSNCSWPSTKISWQRIHLDFATFKDTQLLIVYDSFSKWIEVDIMSCTSSDQTIDKLSSHFSRFGLPYQVVSDNGPQFSQSTNFVRFMKMNNITYTPVPVYDPASNGSAEKTVQTVKKAFKKTNS